MRDVGSYVVYRKEVCQISQIKKNYFKGLDYYHLVPIEDETLQVDVPVNIDKKLLRDLITKKEVERIISKLNQIETLDLKDKNLENTYKELLNSDNLEDYVRIIKTTYLRNKERVANKRKASDKDNYYFHLAEKYLYNEFSIVLGMSYEETKDYILKKAES